MSSFECDRLADRFKKMAADGLVDVKFFLRDLDGSVLEQVCAEVNAFYDAIERGEAKPIEFKDSHRLDSDRR